MSIAHDAMPTTLPLRALIADDEPVARRGLRVLLAEQPGVTVVGEAATGEAALVAVRELRPDLLFLDVQMPALDGFGVLARLPVAERPAVVFTTAYEHYALPAFEASALDYLLKPFDATRLERALRRVRAHLRGAAPSGSAPVRERFVVRAREGVVFVAHDAVEWLESWGNYVRLHAGARRYLLRETTAAVEGTLDPALFVRISRSAIVNAACVRRIVPQANGQLEVVLASGARLRASRRHAAAVRRFLALP